MHLIFKMLGLSAIEGPVVFFFHNFYTFLRIGEIGGVIFLVLGGLAVLGTVTFIAYTALSHNTQSITQMLSTVLHGLPLPFLSH